MSLIVKRSCGACSVTEFTSAGVFPGLVTKRAEKLLSTKSILFLGLDAVFRDALREDALSTQGEASDSSPALSQDQLFRASYKIPPFLRQGYQATLLGQVL